MLLMVRLAFPVLLREMVWAPLVVPTPWAVGKFRVRDEGVATGPVPVPVRVTVWGLVVALSVRDNVAVREEPGALGANVTVIVQLFPAASELPQVLLVTEKSVAFVPVICVPVMFKLVFPLLVRVRSRAAFDPTATLPEKLREEEERPATGPLPEPERVIVWGFGLLVALSAIVTAVPVTVAVVAGVKVTAMVQVPPAATGLAGVQVLPVKVKLLA